MNATTQVDIDMKVQMAKDALVRYMETFAANLKDGLIETGETRDLIVCKLTVLDAAQQKISVTWEDGETDIYRL